MNQDNKNDDQLNQMLGLLKQKRPEPWRLQQWKLALKKETLVHKQGVGSKNEAFIVRPQLFGLMSLTFIFGIVIGVVGLKVSLPTDEGNEKVEAHAEAKNGLTAEELNLITATAERIVIKPE